MKVKIEIAVFKMRDSGIIYNLNVYSLTDRSSDTYSSNDTVEFLGFQFVEVEV